MNDSEWDRLSPEQKAEAWRLHQANQPGYPAGPVWDPNTATQTAPRKRPFYKKKRYMIPLVLVVLLILVLSTTSNSGSNTSTPGAAANRPTAPARAITARDWQLIAKDPDAHKGESIIVYGQVIQFDAATGTDGFRADVDGITHPLQDGFADYSTNTVMGGDAATLKNVVEKDVFKASVTVAGSTSYDTQIGGHTTAPLLQVQSIQVRGHTN